MRDAWCILLVAVIAAGFPRGAHAQDEDELDAPDVPDESTSEPPTDRAPSEGESTARSSSEPDPSPPTTTREPGATVSLLAGPERSPEVSLVLPPLHLERDTTVRTTAIFPLYFEREAGADRQWLVGPYFRRRSPTLDADVLFPFYWHLRGPTHRTVIVPPFWHHADEDGAHWGLFPVVAHGRDGARHYTLVPPLLAYARADARSALTIVGPFWRARDDDEVDWGLFPLVWGHDGPDRSHQIVAPLFFRFADHDARTVTTVLPPVYHRIRPDGASWGLVPILLHAHDESSTSWTVPPLLLHYSRGPDALRLVTPLAAYFDVEGHRTLITPLYQRHRGATELDAVAPFFFSWRDPRRYASALLIPPWLWRFEDPEGSTTVVFPFYARVHARGLYTTWLTPLFGHYRNHTRDAAGTWIFPSIEISHTPHSRTFNVHPLLYSTNGREGRHLVVAPLYWDFERYASRSRTTIFFPFFWRFRRGETVSQLAGNVYYRAGRDDGEPSWELHVFPLFAYGERGRAGDHWWKVLYGLLGYERRGPRATAQLFWVPFDVDGPDPATGRAPTVAAAR
ncbi:MAG: hypothetical protein NZ898_10635 [Myxococcota bacterium]|nr:hypothetical protein [Myxococcota bacterium]MDW8361364.1 hypothetical protein [Myxococcales bacterium]